VSSTAAARQALIEQPLLAWFIDSHQLITGCQVNFMRYDKSKRMYNATHGSGAKEKVDLT
jgi:hypothetical protein